MKAKLRSIICLGIFAIFCIAINTIYSLVPTNNTFAEDNIVNVSNETEFINAINNATSDSPITIQLTNDIIYTASDGLTILEGNITIDNNGHKISTTNSKYLFSEIFADVSLTFVNTEMTEIHDSVIGDNYGSITFQSTAGEGIKTIAVANSCTWQFKEESNKYAYVCTTDGNIITNSYNSIHFVNGNYYSAGGNIVGYADGKTITIDNGYYRANHAILAGIENANMTISNGEFISEAYYAFDSIYNSRITFWDGKVTSYYGNFYTYDSESDNNVEINIYNGTFESLENDAIIDSYINGTSTTIVNIYNGNFTSHKYYLIDNLSCKINIYGGTFKFESIDGNDYPVIYNQTRSGSPTGTINLLGEATFETNGATSSVFNNEGDSIVNVDSAYYYADPEDFLTNHTAKLDIRAFTSLTVFIDDKDSTSTITVPVGTTIGSLDIVSRTNNGDGFVGWKANNQFIDTSTTDPVYNNIHITAVYDEGVIYVSNEAEFIEAMSTTYSTKKIILLDNITYTAENGLTIVGSDIVIDNNGYKISTTNAKYLINEIFADASLTFVNTEMTEIYDSVIGDNYGSVTFESTAGEGINIPNNIIDNNYGNVHFIGGNYISANNIIGYIDGGTVAFDDGYYKVHYAILDAIENAEIIVNNGEFVVEAYYAFDDIVNSKITFKNGKITAREECFYIYDINSSDNTILTIENGTFESINNAIIGSYTNYDKTSIINIYNGTFLSHKYNTIDNFGSEMNLYGGEFKFVSVDDKNYPVIIIDKNRDNSAAGIVNLLGQLVLESDAVDSLIVSVEEGSIINIDPKYYATPKDFLMAKTNKVQILPRDIEFNMTYLPGGDEATVINLPTPDSGISRHEYTVSSTIPEREGYKFLGWILDYKTKTHSSYKICYLDVADRVTQLADCETITDVEIGSEITITNDKEITDYKPVEEQTKSITIEGKDDTNIINFYYRHNTVTYTVHYVDKNNNDIITPVIREKLVGTNVTEYAEDLTNIYNEYGYPYLLDDNNHIDIEVTEETDGKNYYFVYDEQTSITVVYVDKYNGDILKTTVSDPVMSSEIFTYTAESAIEALSTNYVLASEPATINYAPVKNPDDNIIYFLYSRLITYTIKYISMYTDDFVEEDKTESVMEGTDVIEYPKQVDGLIAAEEKHQWRATRENNGTVKFFKYYATSEQD